MKPPGMSNPQTKLIHDSRSANLVMIEELGCPGTRAAEPSGSTNGADTSSLPFAKVDIGTMPFPFLAKPFSTRLAEAHPAHRDGIMGELLYPRGRAICPGKAGKITGTLLENDHEYLIGALGSPDQLLLGIQMARAAISKDDVVEDQRSSSDSCKN